MERWSGKVAVLTGASSGIGAETAEALVRDGLTVVGLARRVERVRELAAKLTGLKGKLCPIECDVTKESDILSAFDWIENKFGGPDILINNAGVLSNESIIEGKTETYRNILDVNVLAVAICTREAVKSMRKRNAEGHIILMNSIIGHNARVFPLPMSLYPSSKYAVSAMALSLHIELALVNANIKVTSISPGIVNTEMLRGFGLPEELIDSSVSLRTKDISDAIIFALAAPPNVQVKELIIETIKTSL